MQPELHSIAPIGSQMRQSCAIKSLQTLNNGRDFCGFAGVCCLGLIAPVSVVEIKTETCFWTLLYPVGLEFRFSSEHTSQPNYHPRNDTPGHRSTGLNSGIGHEPELFSCSQRASDPRLWR